MILVVYILCLAYAAPFTPKVSSNVERGIYTPSNHSKAFDNTLTLRPPRLGFIDRLLRRYCIIALDPSPTREARTTRPAKPVLSPLLASPIPARNSFNFLRFRQNCSYPSCPANLPYNCETALSFPAPYVTTLFPFMKMSSTDSKKQANLSRIRTNQRLSRARRKEYISSLESRIREHEEKGVQATLEIQLAARKVAEENQRLRELLGKVGVSEAGIREYLQQPPSQTPCRREEQQKDAEPNECSMAADL